MAAGEEEEAMVKADDAYIHTRARTHNTYCHFLSVYLKICVCVCVCFTVKHISLSRTSLSYRPLSLCL